MYCLFIFYNLLLLGVSDYNGVSDINEFPC